MSAAALHWVAAVCCALTHSLQGFHLLLCSHAVKTIGTKIGKTFYALFGFVKSHTVTAPSEDPLTTTMPLESTQLTAAELVPVKVATDLALSKVDVEGQ